MSTTADSTVCVTPEWKGRIHSGRPVIFGGRFYSGLIALTNSKYVFSANHRRGSGSSLLALDQVYRLQQGRSEQNHTTCQQSRDIYQIIKSLLAMKYPIKCWMMTSMAGNHPNWLLLYKIQTTRTGLARSRDPFLSSFIGSLYRSSEYLQGRRKHFKITGEHSRIIYNHDWRYSASLNPLWRSM